MALDNAADGPAVNMVLLLVMFLWTFNDFNTPFVLFGNAQPPAGDLISFHIDNASFLTWNFGSGAAMSVMLLLFLLLVSGIYRSLNRRLSVRETNVPSIPRHRRCTLTVFTWFPFTSCYFSHEATVRRAGAFTWWPTT